MKKTLAPLALALCLGTALSGCGSSNSNTSSGSLGSAPAAPVGLPNGPATQAQVLRGRYIVTSNGCADCHNRGAANPNDPNWLAGYIANPTINPTQGGSFQIGNITTYARNLTPDSATGLGTWSATQIHDALKYGKDNTGTPLCPPMPWAIYSQMTESDLWSIVAYLQSIKAVSNAVPAEVGPNGSAVNCSIFYPSVLPTLPAYPAANEIEVVNNSGPGLPSSTATRSQVLQGRYLMTAQIDCANCHSVGGDNPASPNWLSGYIANATVNPARIGLFQVGNTTVYAKNLTPDVATGLGSFTAQQLFSAIHDGVDPMTGKPLCPPMPWPTFHNMTDSDVWAIVAYLQSLKPVSNNVPDPQGPDCSGLNQITVLPTYPGTNELR